MATVSAFKQNCPSCDHPVPIKDPKMVGRKIDCPKCKYRFIVEKPADEVEEVEEAPKKKGATGVTGKKPAGNGVSAKAAPAKGKKAPARSRDDDDDVPRKKKAGGMSPIVMIGAGLGGVAVIGLIICVLFWTGVFGGDSSPSGGGGGGGQQAGGPPGGGGPPPVDDKKPPVDNKPPGPIDVGDTTSLTNLLPNESEAVRDFKLDKLIETPVGNQMLFDSRISFNKNAFQDKFGFSPDLIARHLQAVNYTRDWYFNVIKVRQQIDMAKLTETLKLEKGPRNPIEGFEYYVVKGQLDPFSACWFSDPTRTKDLGLFKLDSTTLVLGDLDQVEHFLEAKTKPTFLSKLPEVPSGGTGGGGQNAGGAGGGVPNPGGMSGGPPMGGGAIGGPGTFPKNMSGGPPMGGSGPPMGGSGSGPPMGGSGSGPPMGGSGPPMGGSGPPMGGSGPPMGGSGAPMGGYPSGLSGVNGSGPPMGGGAPMGGGGPPMAGGGPPMGGGGPPMGGGNPNAGGGNPNPGGNPPPPPVGSYMTIDPDLKGMLDRGLAMKPAPIINEAYLARIADKVQGSVADKLLLNKELYQAVLGEQSDAVLAAVKMAFRTFGEGVQSFGSDRLVGWLAYEMQNDTTAKTLETAFSQSILPQMAAGAEQAFPGLKIALAPPPQAGNAGGNIGGGPPMGGFGPPMGGFGPPMGGSGPPMGGGAPMGGYPAGLSGVNGSGPPMGGGAPMGGYPAGLSGVNGGGPPMGGGFPGPGNIGGGPPMAGGFPNPGGTPSTAPADLSAQRQDQTVIVKANLKLVPVMYDNLILLKKPVYVKARGQSEMMSGRPRIHELAAALKACVEKNSGSFPQGAYPRPSPAERAGRPWPPDQRISWLAQVIRFLPQFAGEDANSYPLGIKPELSWREQDNLVAATTLIPQFLGSKSTKDQWWVRYPKLDQEVAGTHFVGVAGIGLDAAYLTEPTRMGVFGIERVTTLAQITDGPDKTIAVLQVPPTFKRPWLAGGGSTVQGVPEKDSIRPFVCAEYNGKRGTYAVMANGDVRFILETIPDDVFKAMCTIAGGEKVDFEQYALLLKPDPNELVAKPGLPGKPAGGDDVKPPPSGGGTKIDAAKLLGKWDMVDKPGFRIEFLADGVAKGYEVKGGVEKEAVSGTYKLEGDSLTMSMPKGKAEETVKITRLTDTECAILDPKDKKEVVMRKAGATPVAPPVGGGGGADAKAQTSNDLKQLVLAYHSLLDATRKPPAKIDDLAPYLEKNSHVAGAVKDGNLVMYWNVDIFKLTAGTSNTVLSYEKDTPTKGGLVGMADGSVKTMTADEFKKAAKPPGQ